MTLILSALLVAAQLPVASDANDLEMALVKTLTQKEVKSLLEILTTFTDDIPKDAPPVFDFGQFQSLDGETKAKLLPKLKKRNFTLDSFTESMTALFSAYFTEFPEELDKLLPTLNDPIVVAWCKTPGRSKTDIKKLRKKIRELQDNKGFMLAQLELTTSSANQALVAKLKPTISATLARIKRTFERQK